MTDAEALDAALRRASDRVADLESRRTGDAGMRDKKAKRWLYESASLRGALEAVGMIRANGAPLTDAELLEAVRGAEGVARRWGR